MIRICLDGRKCLHNRDVLYKFLRFMLGKSWDWSWVVVYACFATRIQEILYIKLNKVLSEN